MPEWGWPVSLVAAALGSVIEIMSVKSAGRFTALREPQWGECLPCGACVRACVYTHTQTRVHAHMYSHTSTEALRKYKAVCSLGEIFSYFLAT